MPPGGNLLQPTVCHLLCFGRDERGRMLHADEAVTGGDEESLLQEGVSDEGIEVGEFRIGKALAYGDHRLVAPGSNSR